MVAEGVEDEETCALLAELGCDLAQGFLFSRPLPEPELQAYLDSAFSRDEASALISAPHAETA